MTTTLRPAARTAERAAPASSQLLDWPSTARVLPWVIALFSAALWVIPIEDVELPVPLPIDPTIDRFAIGVTVILWLLALVGPADQRPQATRSVVGAAVGLWLSAIVLSIVLNVVELSRLGELGGALRAATVALSIGALFLTVVTTLRPAEVRRLLGLQVVLAALTAVGVIVEFRTGTNLFYRLAELVPGLRVGAPPQAVTDGGRPDITGPTGHGLAVATILAMTVPLAAAGVLRARAPRYAVGYGLVLCLLVAGCVATQRKTGAIVPAVALVAFLAYRPRQAIRWAPLALPIVVIMQVAAPGALSGLRYQFSIASDTGSTTGRTEDYAAVHPDVVSHLLTGRGFGTYDPLVYRFLDNQILGQLIGIGVVGVVAYLGVLVAGGVTAHRLARFGTPEDRLLGAALVGGIAAYGVSNVLFDTLAFRNAPYLLVFYLAYAVILSRAGAGVAERASQLPSKPKHAPPPW